MKVGCNNPRGDREGDEQFLVRNGHVRLFEAHVKIEVLEAMT